MKEDRHHSIDVVGCFWDQFKIVMDTRTPSYQEINGVNIILVPEEKTRIKLLDSIVKGQGYKNLESDEVEHVIECGHCEGKGLRKNEDYMSCKSAKFRDAHNINVSECRICPILDKCRKGESIECSYCNGNGYKKFFGKLRKKE